MKTSVIDTQEAPNKWWAARDAQMRNYAKSTHYSEQQKVAAERMKIALDFCYSHSGIYINYRDRFIAVKVTDARVKNKFELGMLEMEYTKRGIAKAESAQGVIYRLPKV